MISRVMRLSIAVTVFAGAVFLGLTLRGYLGVDDGCKLHHVLQNRDGSIGGCVR